jgi:hypothetical protein
MSTPPSNSAFSDDGMWWWDGQVWQPAVSPDGRMRWDGRQWQPISGQPISGQPVPLGSPDESTAVHTIPTVPVRFIKIGGAAAAIVALVAVGSLVLTRVLPSTVLIPAVLTGSGYTAQMPQGWRLYTPDAQCVTAFGHDSAPNVHLCVPNVDGSDQSYSIEIYVGVSLDAINFKPPPPLKTPGFGQRTPIAFPGSARSEEISCDELGGGGSTLPHPNPDPWWCWRVPGGQPSDSVSSGSPPCGVETPNPDPTSNGRFLQLERFVSASHASRDYLFVLSGYHGPRAGFPEQYCRDFYRMLQSLKWQG